MPNSRLDTFAERRSVNGMDVGFRPMKRSRISGFWLTAATSTVGALLFAFSGGLSFAFTARNVFWLGVIGATVGATAAPYIEPGLFRHPRLWQVFFTTLSSVFVAAALEAGPEGYALALAVGVVLGYLAPYWIGHMQLP
jgi:hypothetical protein